jgi:hypothetical protein
VDAHAVVQMMASVVKMETMLEEYDTEEQRTFSFFCGQKKSANDIHKKSFLFTVESIWRVKRFTTGWW